MDYDKNSFLAGMSVGMTMKGWAGGGGGLATGGIQFPLIIKQEAILTVQTKLYVIADSPQSIPVYDFSEIEVSE